MTLFRALVILAALLLAPAAAQAHKPSDSYLGLRITDSGVDGEWKIALRDLDFAIGLDSDDDGAITWGELRSHHAAIAAYALSRLRVEADAHACALRAVAHLVDSLSDGAYEVLRFGADCGRRPRALIVDYSLFFDVDPLHRGLLRLEDGGLTQTAIFSPDQRRQELTVGEAAPVDRILAYGKEGVWHIWRGYDHLLFLLTLLLPAVLHRGDRRWQKVDRLRDSFCQVAGIVSAFTVAHSITLTIAALGIVALPSRLVESAIAASIIVAALNNLRPVITRRLWAVAFLFGLVHGFGFASVLLDLGLPRGALLGALFGFNLGVEAGQLAVVTGFLPLAYACCRWRLYPRAILQPGSAAVVAVASLWLMQRAFDLTLLPWR